MAQLLQLFIWAPLVAFVITLLIPRKKEKIISGITIFTSCIHLAGVLILIAFWLFQNHPILDIKHIVLFKSGNIEIFIDFYFDRITAVFCAVGSLIAFLVSVFSRYYMHRDEGFKRYFSTILLFFLGYNLVIFSGNFETLFVGWEILGICSFLLIAFYRDRYLPVKNGLKVISFYRMADACLLLAMWMSHHLWHENITFLKLNNVALSLDVPKSIIKRIQMKSLRLTYTANNLFTITRYSGYDPEVSSAKSTDGSSRILPGVDYSSYPYSRTHAITLSFTF